MQSAGANQWCVTGHVSFKHSLARKSRTAHGEHFGHRASTGELPGSSRTTHARNAAGVSAQICRRPAACRRLGWRSRSTSAHVAAWSTGPPFALIAST